MSDSIPLHPDDLDTVLRHMLEVERYAGHGAPNGDWETLPAEEQARWRRLTEKVCAGGLPKPEDVCMVAVIAARGMARVLAERRRAHGDALAVAEKMTGEAEEAEYFTWFVRVNDGTEYGRLVMAQDDGRAAARADVVQWLAGLMGRLEGDT